MSHNHFDDHSDESVGLIIPIHSSDSWVTQVTNSHFSASQSLYNDSHSLWTVTLSHFDDTVTMMRHNHSNDTQSLRWRGQSGDSKSLWWLTLTPVNYNHTFTLVTLIHSTNSRITMMTHCQSDDSQSLWWLTATTMTCKNSLWWLKSQYNDSQSLQLLIFTLVTQSQYDDSKSL